MNASLAAPAVPSVLRLSIDGQMVGVLPGSSVASAIAVAVAGGVSRISRSGQPRAPLCGMGVCFECRATVDGRAQQRTCLLPAADGMEVLTHG